MQYEMKQIHHLVIIIKHNHRVLLKLHQFGKYLRVGWSMHNLGGVSDAYPHNVNLLGSACTLHSSLLCTGWQMVSEIPGNTEPAYM